MRSSVVVRYTRKNPRLSRCNNKKQKQKKQYYYSGFIGPVFVVVVTVLITGIVYLFTVNANAMQGKEVRKLEVQISALEKEHEQLRIKTAELTSLYRIEESSESLKMADIVEPAFVSDQGPLALRE